MSLDSIKWLADRAGWAWLADEDGQVRMNGRAQDLVGDTRGSFDELAAVLADLSVEAAAAAVDRTELAGRDGRSARWLWTDDGSRILVVVPAERAAPAPKLPAPADDDLARAVGHELGNALGALVGWIGLLQENPATLTAEALERLQRAATTARRAARDLLGGPDEAEANVAEVIQDVARLLEPTAHQGGTKIVVEASAGDQTRFRRGELFRMVWNLALNAVQITQGGTVTLGASERNGRLLLTVEDDGPGIPADIRPRIFEPGYGERDGGSGLGLALVARTVRSLDGAVKVWSEVGQGTRFEIRLPIAPRTSAVMGRLASPRRVLAVEDDAGIRELVHTTLSLRGVDVTVVSTLAGARAAVAEASKPFDLAIADLTLPDGRGDELLAELKTSGKVARTLLMSGHADPGELTGPPDGWLGKPFDVPELVAAVDGQPRPAQPAEVG